MSKKGGNNGGGGGGSDPGGGGGTITVKGGRGDDVLYLQQGYALENTFFDGGKGTDTIDLRTQWEGGPEFSNSFAIFLDDQAGQSSKLWVAFSYTGLPISQRTSEWEGTRKDGTIKNVDSIIGGSGDDWIQAFWTSGPGVRIIDGGPGNDVIKSRHKSDAILIGGTGQDWIFSGGTNTYINNILVGGAWNKTEQVAGLVPSGDGEADVFIADFYTAGNITILDFEIGVDKLVFQVSQSDSPPSALLNPEWEPTVAYGLSSSKFSHNGTELTLVGLTPDQARDIPVAFVLGSTFHSVLQGGPGDDYFFAYQQAETFLFPSGSGHDFIHWYDVANDVLVFSDGAPDAWTEIMVNGQVSLKGFFDSGNSSVTLLGLSLADAQYLPTTNPEITTVGSSVDSIMTAVDYHLP
jgi:hypothetical protein